jgi:LacI family transcriptional regulator
VYLEKIAAAGLPQENALLRCCGYQMEDGYQETLALLDLAEPPTAIWAINDLLAIGALRAIQDRGLHIPRDIALAGFDDIPLASQLTPPLTTVHMPSREMGQRAVGMLFTRLEQPGLEPMQELLETRLVVREST